MVVTVVDRGWDLLPARGAEWFSGSAQVAEKKKTLDQRVLQVGGFSWTEAASPSSGQATRLGTHQDKCSPICLRAVSPQPMWGLPKARAMSSLPD